MKKTIYIAIGVLSFLSFGSELKAQDKSEGNKRASITIYPAEIIYPKDIPTNQKLVIFPNPANSFVDIRLNVPETQGFNMELYDGLGKLLLRQKWDGGSFDLLPFPSGVYLLNLRRNQEVYSQKLLIQR